MTQSLRRTLAVRFAATMAAGLALVSGALFLGMSYLMHKQFDQALAGAEVLVAGQVENGSPPSISDLLTSADPAAYARTVNRYAALRRPSGELIRAFPLIASDLPVDSAALERARVGSPIWVDGLWKGQPVRSLYGIVPEAGTGAQQVMQVAAYLGPLHHTENLVLLALAGVVVLGTVATLVGGWNFVGSAVEPVLEITRQATQIEAGTLSRRIAAHAGTDEYRGLVAVLNRMLERLDNAFRTQRRLTADVGHELRTPLTALRGEIEVALRTDRSPREYQLVLRSALEEIAHLSAMSDDLLLITRAESHQVEPHRVPTDPNALVRASVAQVRRRLEEKDLRLDESLDRAVQDVALDPELVSRALDHLLDNAVKYTPEGGRIRVTTEPAAPATRGVRFGVENTGSAIPSADLPHIFEPFFRADQSRTRAGGGPGLGLALVAAIAELHGGAARASNRNGSSVRLEVEIPAPAAA
ncbi:MAG TPA: ATP-binding protein [Gemmatimonadales bacterium]|nr:ATP-binding protein [Gemmatimonadales bacterium]